MSRYPITLALHGGAGAIAVDRRGNLAMVFNTSGMYRGAIRGDGVPHTAIWRSRGISRSS